MFPELLPNRSHFPQNPHPASSRECHRNNGLSRTTHSLWNSTMEATTAFPHPPKRKDAGMAAKETAGKIPRGGCDSMPLSKRVAEQQRATIMSSVVYLVNLVPFKAQTPLFHGAFTLPNPQLPLLLPASHHFNWITKWLWSFIFFASKARNSHYRKSYEKKN